MPNELEQIITELEAVGAQLLASTCWGESGEFGDLLARRGVLAAQLRVRTDLDASAAQRIGAAIESGHLLLARVIAMRNSLVAELAETGAQERFSSEMSSTLPCQAKPHLVNINA